MQAHPTVQTGLQFQVPLKPVQAQGVGGRPQGRCPGGVRMPVYVGAV